MAQSSTPITHNHDVSAASITGHPSTNDATNSPAAEPITSPVIAPPYWRQDEQLDSTRSRASSRAAAAGQITLIDNTTDQSSSQALACWARSAQIHDWTIVEGALGSIGSYVVFNCIIETTSGSTFKINKRYSEFDTLHRNLITTFPNSKGAAIPPIPPKSAFYKFQTKFLDKRKDGLEYFLHNVICNPEFAASPVLKDFLFA